MKCWNQRIHSRYMAPQGKCPREVHVRFSESARVKFPRAIQLWRRDERCGEAYVNKSICYPESVQFCQISGDALYYPMTNIEEMLFLLCPSRPQDQRTGYHCFRLCYLPWQIISLLGQHRDQNYLEDLPAGYPCAEHTVHLQPYRSRIFVYSFPRLSLLQLR